MYLPGYLYPSIKNTCLYHVSPGLSPHDPSWSSVDTFLRHRLQPEGHFKNGSHASSPLILSSWIPIVLGIKKQILSKAYWLCSTRTLQDSAVSLAFPAEEPPAPDLQLPPFQCSVSFTVFLLEYSFLLPFLPAAFYSNFRFSADVLLSWENRADNQRGWILYNKGDGVSWLPWDHPGYWTLSFTDLICPPTCNLLSYSYLCFIKSIPTIENTYYFIF